AGTAGGADDDIQAARACPAGKGLRLDAELTRQPQRHPFAARREVDGRLRVREARRAADLLDRVAEGDDAARDLARAGDVAAGGPAAPVRARTARRAARAVQRAPCP